MKDRWWEELNAYAFDFVAERTPEHANYYTARALASLWLFIATRQYRKL